MGLPHLVAIQSFDREGRIYSLHTIPFLYAIGLLAAFGGLGVMLSTVVTRNTETIERGQNVAIARVAQEYPPLAAIWLGTAPR